MAPWNSLQVFFHPSIHMPHLHTLQSHAHLSPSCNQQETPILPHRCDDIGRTCNATREACEATRGGSNVKRDQKAMLSLGNVKGCPPMSTPFPIHPI